MPRSVGQCGERERRINQEKIQGMSWEKSQAPTLSFLFPLFFPFSFLVSCNVFLSSLCYCLTTCWHSPTNSLKFLLPLPQSFFFGFSSIFLSHIHAISYCIVTIYYFLNKLKESGKGKKREKKGVGMRFVAVVIPAALVPPAIHPWWRGWKKSRVGSCISLSLD